jgi:hypothetical protein
MPSLLVPTLQLGEIGKTFTFRQGRNPVHPISARQIEGHVN